MKNQSQLSVLSLSLASFLLGGTAEAQVQSVNVMPGYPNAPRTSIDQRRLTRPGSSLLLWGNANEGSGTANGFDYTWTVLPGTNVAFTDDGSLSGVIVEDSFIDEEVTFSLLNGATSGLAEVMLSVTDGATTQVSSLEIGIIDTADPLSDTELEKQQIDVNISIDEGLRYLYTRQQHDGSWEGSITRIGSTGFSLWALQNQGHLATNDVTQDILARRVQAGLNYLFERCQVQTGIAAPHADVARGATANGVSDMNSNGQAISFGPISIAGAPGSGWGYEHPIATAALAASISPNQVVNVGPAAGMTYKELGKDCMDMIGVGQVDVIPARGGWRYVPTEFSSDMSINSWHYVAMEGLYVTFGIDIPDWILQECESNLIFHQANLLGAVPFGYADSNRLVGYPDGQATTGGGLSGLYAVELQGPHTAPGSVINAEPAPLNSVAAKRTAALDYLGEYWGEESFDFAKGNLGNLYAMWTVARALRLTAFALGLPSGEVVTLENMGTSFDWETGEENGSGVLAAPGSDREGYFSYLVRNQNLLSGGWSLDWMHPDLDTALAVLVLTPKVFLIEPPDDGGGGDHGGGDTGVTHTVLGKLDVDIRTSHIYGTVAAGNDLYVETSNLGLGVSPEETDSMIADRDIHAQIGLLDHGNVVAGNALNIAPTFGIAGGTLAPRIEDVIDFDAVLDYVSSLTTTMGALSPTGTVEVSQDNLVLSAHNGIATEIFLVSAAQLEAARDVTIDVDAGSNVIVNIEGGNLSPVQFGVRLHDISPDKVLFNAFEASEIYIADVNFDGSLFAQTGDVEIEEIDVAGQLVAGGDISLQTTRVFGELFSGDLESFLPFMGGLSVQEPSDVLLHNLVLTPGESGDVFVSHSGSSLIVTVNGLTRHFRFSKIDSLTFAGVSDMTNVEVEQGLELDIHLLEQQPLGGQDVFMLDQFDVPETGRGMINMDLFSNDLAGSSGLDIGSFQVVKRPEHAVVRFDAKSGLVRYLWDASKWSSDSFEYTVLDGNGVRSAPVEVRVLR